MTMIEVKVKKLTPDAKLPTYATDGSGCFDIYTTSYDEALTTSAAIVFDTGLSFEIPKDHVMLVFSRSGMGFKNNIRLSNCVGVIDSDYRGELKVSLIKDYTTVGTLLDYFSPTVLIEKGSRIAQGLVLPISKVYFNEVQEGEELEASERGEGGFGSTGN